MSTKNYSLGIAFSGGGAKGAAHCGALQALKEYGLKPDVVSGTSVGALVAVLYSSGLSPKQMIETFQGMNFFKDIVAPSLPKGGLFDSRPLQTLIRNLLPYSRLEDLPIPTYIVASDMEHGVSKVFSKGEIAPRVVASCSIPVIFQPIYINGVHYVDGGAFQNLPVSAIRQKCEKVIALNLNHLEEEKFKNNLAAVAYRAFMMMMVSNEAADSAQADLFVELDTYGCMAHDISRIEELFFRGYESTVKVLEENGYQRVMPKEDIKFHKKNRKKNNAHNSEEVLRNTFEKGLAAIRALGKGNIRMNINTKEIYLAGGCFWGTEHYFKQLEGVVETEVGFANGHTENPTYKEVYTDETGYAETVRVKYNPDVVGLEFLLRMFFKAIDPVSVNKQGHDEGTRYRTGIYYTDAADLPVIEKVFAEEQQQYDQSLAVEKQPLDRFYPAEEYHQDYLDKNPDGYCHLPLSLFEFARNAKDNKAFLE